MARPSKSEERKEQILNAFERCVVRSGIQGVTLEKVAKEAGLPRSLVRHFVGNRDDMAAAVFDRFMRRVEALWSGKSQNLPSIDDMLEFLVKEAFIGGGVGRLASELRYQRNFDENARAHFKGIFQRAQRFVEDVLRENGFDDATERREKAFLVLALAFGTTDLIAFGLPKKRAELSIQACKQLLES
jgi:AcrR family transcriptional regulator